MTGKFDLNIEQILENWEPYHAVREIIANALDEQILSDSEEINIYKKDKNRWCIRDFGRGLRHTHLTQNENSEKLQHRHVIGKFGIGLKDALATLNRHNIDVLIQSRYADITLTMSHKQDFEEIITLHADISEPSHPFMKGTEFTLSGIEDDEIQKAKNLFLKFSDEKVIQTTRYGEIIQKTSHRANIYINGVRVATEENFLFSYNITELNSSIKKALNRERTNVGRSAYAQRIKSILLSCSDTKVARLLSDDLQNYSLGYHHDELNWLDVQEHAVKILNQQQDILFATPQEVQQRPSLIDDATNEGYTIVTVPERLKERIHETTDLQGNSINDLSNFITSYNESFSFHFIDIEDLTPKEREVYAHTEQLFRLIGGKPSNIREIVISETMRPGQWGENIQGLWDEANGQIILHRPVLQNLEIFAGVLLHEAAHAKSGYGDVSREFESELTRMLGTVSQKALQKPSPEQQPETTTFMQKLKTKLYNSFFIKIPFL